MPPNTPNLFGERKRSTTHPRKASQKKKQDHEPKQCSQCGGNGGMWIYHNGIRWTVRDLAPGPDGKPTCAFCRAHPDLNVTAALFDDCERFARTQAHYGGNQ